MKILDPRPSLDNPRIHLLDRIEPRPVMIVLQILPRPLLHILQRNDVFIEFEAEEGSPVFGPRGHCFGDDGELGGDAAGNEASGRVGEGRESVEEEAWVVEACFEGVDVVEEQDPIAVCFEEACESEMRARGRSASDSLLFDGFGIDVYRLGSCFCGERRRCDRCICSAQGLGERTTQVRSWRAKDKAPNGQSTAQHGTSPIQAGTTSNGPLLAIKRQLGFEGGNWWIWMTAMFREGGTSSSASRGARSAAPPNWAAVRCLNNCRSKLKSPIFRPTTFSCPILDRLMLS